MRFCRVCKGWRITSGKLKLKAERHSCFSTANHGSDLDRNFAESDDAGDQLLEVRWLRGTELRATDRTNKSNGLIIRRSKKHTPQQKSARIPKIRVGLREQLAFVRNLRNPLRGSLQGEAAAWGS